MTYYLKIPPYYRLEITPDDIALYSDRHPSSHKLKFQLQKRGYLSVYLAYQGGPGKYQRKNIKVHKLVAEATYGPRPSGKVINHKDGNKLNNHPSNLEYVTLQENIQHAVALGLGYIGAKNGRYKHGRYCKESLCRI